ncbi:MAG: Fic family protein [Bdellovibrionia bacterium]
MRYENKNPSIDELNSQVPVVITGTQYVPPPASQVPSLMKKFIKQLPALRKKLHPVDFVAQVHLRLVHIHPFVDGNGRTARLLMNLALSNMP